MPRTLVRAPGYDPNRSLGWLAVAWMEFFCVHGRGDVQGQPVVHGDEMTEFIVGCYAVGDSPQNNHMLHDSAFFSRPKGADKSGLGARFALFEALGPCRFDGWARGGWARGGEVYEDPWGLGFRHEYQPGEPMGRHVTDPFVRIMATEEGQTGNVYDSVYFNLTDERSKLSRISGIDAGVSRIFLPGGGRIQPSTASSSSKDGGLETFTVFDESHIYNTPELRRMYKVVRQNLLKRKKTAGTWFLESTTMFAQGEDSVAQATFGEAEAIATDAKKRGKARLLYDHRWGECEDLRDEAALRAAIEEAFGEAIAWQDIDGLVDQAYDTRTDPVDFRRYFLNAETSAKDAWMEARVWDACARPDRALALRDVITLGFDGSRGGVAGEADATALVACRVSDGHLELLGIWEQPEDLPAHTEWRVDEVAVDAAVAAAMKKYQVVGFFADPSRWQDYLNIWHRQYAAKMQAKVTLRRPLEWETNQPKRMVSALERFYEAAKSKSLSFTPSVDRVEGEADRAKILRRHVLNAKRYPTRAGLQIRKEYPKSPRKIDACMAAVLAYEARAAAISAGVPTTPRKAYRVKRLR